MPSPVTGDDIPVINGTAKACDEMRQILEMVRQFKSFLDFQLDDSGLPKVEPAREMGAIIWPPGTLRDIAMAAGVGEEAAREIVEKTWLNQGELDSYSDDPASVEPFWVMADYRQKLGAPNLSGAFRLTADYRPLTEGNRSQVVGPAQSGGSHEVVLTVDQLPEHTHDVKEVPVANINVDLEGPGGPNRVYDSKNETPEPVQTLTSEPTGKDKPHTNMPPYYTVVTAFRTTRMS